MTKHLYVTARFSCLESVVDETIQILEELARTTRTESGCIRYGYFQATDNATSFTSIEQWEDMETEAAHWETEHLKVALEQLGPCLDGEAEVTKYHKIGN